METRCLAQLAKYSHLPRSKTSWPRIYPTARGSIHHGFGVRDFTCAAKRCDSPLSSEPAPAGQSSAPSRRPGQYSRRAGQSGQKAANPLASVASRLRQDRETNFPKITPQSRERAGDEVVQRRPRKSGAPSVFGSRPSTLTPGQLAQAAAQQGDSYHRMSIYSHKHNTHVTLANPVGHILLSASCGNVGFRKANRSTFDAAYQLGAHVMGRIAQQGLLMRISAIELSFRGFGPGREAMTRILLGIEGSQLRRVIKRVVDRTRTKFGGTRSKNKRRL